MLIKSSSVLMSFFNKLIISLPDSGSDSKLSKKSLKNGMLASSSSFSFANCSFSLINKSCNEANSLIIFFIAGVWFFLGFPALVRLSAASWFSNASIALVALSWLVFNFLVISSKRLTLLSYKSNIILLRVCSFWDTVVLSFTNSSVAFADSAVTSPTCVTIASVNLPWALNILFQTSLLITCPLSFL